MCTRGIPEFVRGKNISARVVAIAGPWRRQGEWWALATETMKTIQENQNSLTDPHLDSRSAPDDRWPRLADSPAPRSPWPGRGVKAGWQANAPVAYARDYYELALADGGVYRMYRDLHSEKWFVDGVYD